MNAPSRVAWLAVALIAVPLASGCTQWVRIRHRLPAEIDTTGVTRLAILPLDGPVKEAGSTLAAALTDKVFREQQYQLIERDRIEKILKEQKFSTSGLVDPTTAQRIGAVLGVDAMVFGDVNAWKVDDEEHKEPRKIYVKTGRKVYDQNGNYVDETREQIIQVSVVTRQASVAATFKMVQVETGRLLATRNLRRPFTTRAEGEGISSLPQDEEILQGLANQIAEEFARMIAAHDDYVTRPLHKDGPGTEQGINYALGGVWDRALECFAREADAMPQEFAPRHDAGVAAEALYRYAEAVKHYERAVGIESDPQTIEAIRYCRERIADRQRLKQG